MYTQREAPHLRLADFSAIRTCYYEVQVSRVHRQREREREREIAAHSENIRMPE